MLPWLFAILMVVVGRKSTFLETFSDPAANFSLFSYALFPAALGLDYLERLCQKLG